MNTQARPADAAQREAALQATNSFIVQAPAGSGKTELLIQRFLRLLAIVDEPEQILAITFTRKAAAEMRERIVAALDRARRGEEPDAPHLKLGYALAGNVIARDQSRGWGLARQPGRLRIGTIDAVNSWLAGRAPWSAGRRALHRIGEDPERLYREAARRTLALAGESDAVADDLRRLLAHCDNRADRVIELVATLLSRRDQWLRHVGRGEVGDSQRGPLEAALASFITQLLGGVDQLMPPDVRERLPRLLSYAAAKIDSPEPGDSIAWREADDWPRASAECLARWRSMARTLLTQKGEWRRSVDKRTGFPPSGAAQKNDMLALLEQLQPHAELAARLHEVQQLPDAAYDDQQWAILKCLVRVLPLAAAMLQEVFDSRRETDYAQVAADALRSLGGYEEISELSLALDYSLRHILLDEFQDTSLSQLDLLRRLTAGWEPGDGRSLFLVGDPMQSIYRFREAEVGIFLRTWADGLPNLPLERLRLQTNFRSDPRIVDWVNQVFARLLPAADDAASGAVSFSPSIAFHGSGPAEVRWHLCASGDRETEVAAVAAAARDAVNAAPRATVGILVRSRAHAAGIGAALRGLDVPYSAPDLELLGAEAVVHDLLALTRALLHRADRIAWLAVLRAHWCGLALADLHVLAADDADADIWERVRDADELAQLSATGRQRLAVLRERLGPWLQRRGACALRELVEGAWLHLGGPAGLDDELELAVADEFFDYLDEVDVGGDCGDVAELLGGIEKRPVIWPETREARVQLMTIHKAKGLEFDTVLLPGLGYATRGSDRPLLLWHELPAPGDTAELVLAPLHARGDERDRLYELLWRLDRRRDSHEQERLLYVAATRAKSCLHLFAAMPPRTEGRAWQPQAGSSLRSLWPAVDSEVEAIAAGHSWPASTGAEAGPEWIDPPLRRLPADWQPPAELADFEWIGHPGSRDTRNGARHIGTVVHRWLEEIAREGAEAWPASRVAELAPAFRRQLAALGLPAAELEAATTRVAAALARCLEDEDGRWLLSAQRREADAELGISLSGEAGEVAEMRLDRSFIDADGQRWIVDYKTSEPGDEGAAEFVAREIERYRGQLAGYRNAIAMLDERPVRAALYFPLLGRLEVVELDD